MSLRTVVYATVEGPGVIPHRYLRQMGRAGRRMQNGAQVRTPGPLLDPEPVCVVEGAGPDEACEAEELRSVPKERVLGNFLTPGKLFCCRARSVASGIV